MPDEVPPNVSQAFKDVIPYALSIFVLYGIDLVTRQFLGTNVAEAILKLFEPLFTAADGYVGITIIFGAYALFWFVGFMVHLLWNQQLQPLLMPILKPTSSFYRRVNMRTKS